MSNHLNCRDMEIITATYIDFSKFNTLSSMMEHFTNDEVCRDAFAQARWHGDVVCPKCGRHHCHKGSGGRYTCNACKHRFGVTVGTIFENTKIGLRKWFIAMYMMSSHTMGVSSCQVARDLGITQKSGWFILHKLRTLYEQDETDVASSDKNIEKAIECDEMYLGGREKNKHQSKKTEGTQGRSTKTKTPVFGMIQRNGKANVQVVDKVCEATLLPIIKKFAGDNAVIFTDELSSYKALDNEPRIRHHVVRHNAEEYVNGNVYTNTIEGFWGNFKLMFFGTYRHAEKRYLQRYIDEYVFKFNTRNMCVASRFRMMFGAACKGHRANVEVVIMDAAA